MIQSPSLESRIHAFAELGKVMGYAAECYTAKETGFEKHYPELYDSLQVAYQQNPWFTPVNIAFALNAWKEILTEESISTWISNYEFVIQKTESKNVAVIMAGNIPLVGFHDFMCTLLAGHNFIGKLSSNDKVLLPALSDVLCTIEPLFKHKILFTENTIKDFDAIIATGSNNTARYFEYYFSKYPHIIRKNRNGVAVLSGNERIEDYEKLGKDICTYFGLGCRNISKVFIPNGFAPDKLFAAIEHYKKALYDHYKFMNNHSYHRSVYLLNSTPHLDNDVLILTESDQYSSPIPVLYYEFYKTLESLKDKLASDDEYIQCIATDAFTGENTVPLGSTQSPGLTDYADGIDTLKFLLEL
jgi:hypothetical protein